MTSRPEELDLEPELSPAIYGGPEDKEGASPTSFARGSQMPPNTFVSRVASAVGASFVEHQPPLQVQQRGRLAKFWFGPAGSIHYEIWLHDRTLQIELGLHFESTTDFNVLLFRAFDKYLLEIHSALGTSLWLEDWDHGWARLYETWPCDKVDPEFRGQMIERLARIVEVLQPNYELSAARTGATA